MGGFTEWVETIADSRDGSEFRDRVSDSENASMWQSLSFKPNYKAAYCLAVCPAGEDVLPPYLDDRRAFMDTVLKPLQDKAEPIVEKRFPHKHPIEVTGGCRDSPVTQQGDLDRR
jgi:hypothetical protein